MSICQSNFEKLPCLEHLVLFRFYKVVKVGDEFLGMDETMMSSPSMVPVFLKLRILHISRFDGWEEWTDFDGDDDISIMPSLTLLKLYGCKKLKALPNFIVEKPSLKMEFTSCDALEL